MKRITLITSAIALSATLLTGCGNESPEEVAKNFAYLITDAKIEKAKSLTYGMEYTFERIQDGCNYSEAQRLKKEASAFMPNLQKSLAGIKKDKELQEKIIAITKDEDEKLNKLAKEGTAQYKEAVKKYGSFRKVPKEEQESILKDLRKQMFDLVKSAMAEVLDIADAEYNEDALNVVALMKVHKKLKVRSYSAADVAIEQLLKENPVKITKECINDNTKFGFIENINFIETKEISPDKSDVRLELVGKNDTSTKVTIQVEKIQDNWKISNI